MNQKRKEENQINRGVEDKEDWSEEAWQNWLGFWNLLLECDMKQNPHLYKRQKQISRGVKG